jgi:TonB-dependent receptor
MIHLAFRRVLRGVAVASFALLAAALSLPAQTDTGQVAGRVTDSASHAVLRGATVGVAGTDRQAATDDAGEFTLALPPGAHQVTIDYLGFAPKTVPVIVRAGETARLDVTLGGNTVAMAAFTVEGTRTGQARALNQQRSAQNLTNVVSSDFSGQFPDKTIADAVKRLPGITVETDRDTGGSEGRYITVRGMTADFNAVTIDGMRVNVTDFDGITRRVPLDVVASDVADEIEVSKALRPDQDADSIGGAVNIKTRSAFSRTARTLSAKAALGYSAILEDYENYPYRNPTSEYAVNFSDVFGAARQWGLSLSANWRERTFVKQRNSTTGWNDTLGYRLGTATTVSPLRGYTMDSFVLQHFFDDVQNYGVNGSLEWRPTPAHKLRLAASFNARDTNRGRQRQTVFFPLFRTSDGSIGGIGATPAVIGDTYASLVAAGNTVRREVRDFDERQTTSTVTLDGQSRVGTVQLTYLVGYNWADWDGGRDTALQAQFQNAGFTNSYQLTPGGARFPTVNAVYTTTGADRNDPALANIYTLRSLVRGTRDYFDDEWNVALDAKRDVTLAGLPGFLKAGAKFRTRDRDYDSTQLSYSANSNWSLAGYTGQADVPSLIANYRANGTANGHYNYGYFLDAARVRAVSNLLVSRNLLVPSSTNAFNSTYDDYQAREDVLSGYALGQFKRDRLTVLAGVRAEQTRTRFDSYSIVDGAPVPIHPRRRVTDWLPSVHLRYDFSANLLARAAYTESIARPTFNQLNPRETRSTTSDTISRGNINLKPVASRNYDLAVERYFGSVGYVSAGMFYKQYRNNVYRSSQNVMFEGELTRITEPRNARGGNLVGVELAADRRFDFLPAPFDGLGATVNYTYASSKLDSDLPALAGRQMPLFDQVKNTINTSLYFDRGPWRLRASMHYRAQTLFELATDNPIALARYETPRREYDFTASYRFRRHWSVFAEFNNLTNAPSWGYNGDKSLRLDYNEYSDWSALFGIRWHL